MKIIKFVGTLSLSLLVAFVSSISEASEMVWGESVGLISATVSAPVDARGVPVRSAPSMEGEILAHLEVGTTVQGENIFANGWARLKSPVRGGWIRLSNLKPHPFEGIVIKVGQSDLCLPLKKGPGSAHENLDCAQIGETLKFSGVATREGWLQLSGRKGWAPLSSVHAAALTAGGTAPETIKPLATREAPAAERSPQKQVPPVQAQAGPSKIPSETKAEEKGEAKACVGEWCVDFSSDTITRAGKPQSFVDCARDNTCARILSEFWVAVLEDEAHVDIPISSSTVLRLGKDGTIRSPSSGNVFANCQGSSGPDSACIMDFLLALSKPIVADLWRQSAGSAAGDRAAEPQSSTGSESKRDGSAATAPASKGKEAPQSARTDTPRPGAEKTTKPQSRKTEKKKRRASTSQRGGNRGDRSASSQGGFSDSFFDEQSRHEEQLEKSWQDADRVIR